ILIVALGGALAGRPFVREFAEVDQPKEVVESELFRKITGLLTWIWVAAFAEAEIDNLIYLATEHANREVGAGKEAYDIRIGSKGVPLVGDETRESWPSTYKVREKKR